MAPPNGTPARRRSTGQLPAQASSPGRPRRSSTAIPRQGAAAKLVCNAGPAQGQEFPLDGDEVVIGRAADVAVSIADTSVSRKHVLLRKTPEGWAASDMGSGNGTMVNGTGISEETALSNGDRIMLGDTELQYVDEATRRPVPRRVSEPSMARGRALPRTRTLSQGPEVVQAKRKRFIRIGALVGVLMMAGIGVKLMQNRKAEAAMVEQRKQQESLGQLQAIFQEGKNLVRAGKWSEAKEKFEQVNELAPGYAQGAVVRYLEATAKEIPNAALLDECTEALKANEVTKASKALAKVTADTQQYERRDRLRVELEGKLKGRIDEARGLLGSTTDKTKMQELLGVANDVLGAIPEQRDAVEFKKVAEAAIFRIEHPAQAAQGPAPTPWVEVQRRYQTGDKTGALAMANECAGKHDKCKTLMKEIQEFDERSRKAESMAPAELIKLLELDRKITGGEASPNSHNVAVRVTTEFYKKAAAAKAKADWAGAMENAQRVLMADPGHAGAQSIVAEARGAAKEMYFSCYQQKDQNPEEAEGCFKRVMLMTPMGDEWHEKATKQLAQLRTH